MIRRRLLICSIAKDTFEFLNSFLFLWRIFKEDTEDNDDEEAKNTGQRYEEAGHYAESTGAVGGDLRRDPAEDNLILFIDEVQYISEELDAAAFPGVGAGVAVNMFNENVDLGQEECQEVTDNDQQSF